LLICEEIVPKHLRKSVMRDVLGARAHVASQTGFPRNSPRRAAVVGNAEGPSGSLGLRDSRRESKSFAPGPSVVATRFSASIENRYRSPVSTRGV
jgi:hypothetical protein